MELKLLNIEFRNVESEIQIWNSKCWSVEFKKGCQN